MELTTGSAAAWAELVSDHFLTLSIGGTDDSFEAGLSACDLGGSIRLTTVRTGRSRVRRGARDVRADASDDVLMLAPLTGSTVVRQEGTRLLVAPGGVSVHVAERPYELEFAGPSEVLVFQAPRQIVASGDLLSLERRRVVTEGAAARIFRAFARETVDAAAGLSDRERYELGGVAVSLAVSVLGRPGSAVPDDGGGRRALLAAAHAYVRSHLSDPGLTPLSVAAHHRVSLRALQLAFSEAGTSPAAFIRGERLARARLTLLAPGSARRGLGVIAREVGYVDVDVFIRAFRREFGETPGALRDRPCFPSR